MASTDSLDVMNIVMHGSIQTFNIPPLPPHPNPRIPLGIDNFVLVGEGDFTVALAGWVISTAYMYLFGTQVTQSTCGSHRKKHKGIYEDY